MSDIRIQIEKEEALAAKTKNSQAAGASASLHKLRTLIDDWESRGVDAGFIQVARELTPLAAGLGMSAGAHQCPAAVLSDLYVGWLNAVATFNPAKGKFLPWVQGKFSRLIKNLKRDLCVPGHGTSGMDSGEDCLSMHEMWADDREEYDEQADAEAAPDLNLGGIMDMVQTGQSLPQIAVATGKNIRTVQRLYKKNKEQVWKIRVAKMKAVGLDDVQILNKLQDGDLALEQRASGMGDITPAPYRAQIGLAADLMLPAQSKRLAKKKAPVEKQKRQTVNLAFIQNVAPQRAFDFGGAI